MSTFDKQIQLGRDLVELNNEWFRKIVEFDRKSFTDYVQFNQDFASRLPEVKDIQSFAELQREYGQQLWSSAQEALKSRGELLQDAFKANGEVIRQAFGAEQEKPQARRTAKGSAQKAAA